MKKEETKKVNKVVGEFKEFISRGNVLDMAVGVIIGSAFSKIVTSLVNDILMPLIGVIIGGINFSTLHIKVSDSIIMYGNFIQNIIDFLIVAACIFFVVKVMNKFKKEETKKEEVAKPSNEELLLTEIRDLLKKKK
jgi:large conductance mechanosensitive channel